eukprot:scaffold66776_cov22-Tisochrysis_lutea.AAC.1
MKHASQHSVCTVCCGSILLHDSTLPEKSAVEQKDVHHSTLPAQSAVETKIVLAVESGQTLEAKAALEECHKEMDRLRRDLQERMHVMK